MTRRVPVLLLSLWLSLSLAGPPLGADPGNPAIDAVGHVADLEQAFRHRAERRISEEEFLRMSREPGTVVLDARSRERFALLHVEGAVNLPLPDFDAGALARLIPDRDTRILIYCNNNFAGAPVAMPLKAAPASLNLSTYPALWSYGYRNVYELAPFVDIGQTLLPLAGLERDAANLQVQR